MSEVRVRRDPATDAGFIPSQFLVVEDGMPSFAQAIDEDENHLADAGIQPRDDSYWNLIKETQRYPGKDRKDCQGVPQGRDKDLSGLAGGLRGKGDDPTRPEPSTCTMRAFRGIPRRIVSVLSNLAK